MLLHGHLTLFWSTCVWTLDNVHLTCIRVCGFLVWKFRSWLCQWEVYFNGGTQQGFLVADWVQSRHCEWCHKPTPRQVNPKQPEASQCTAYDTTCNSLGMVSRHAESCHVYSELSILWTADNLSVVLRRLSWLEGPTANLLVQLGTLLRSVAKLLNRFS